MRTFRDLADHTQERSIGRRLRQKRFEFFLGFLTRIPGPISILDVGGTRDYWRDMSFDPPPGTTITLANVSTEQCSPPFNSVAADASDLSLFPDQSFDLVFSNSVIEHVDTREGQERMAAEIRRVGRRYFVQTPYRFFPIEPHFLLPGFQFMPRSTRGWLASHLNLGFYGYPRLAREEALYHATTIRLLSIREMRRLFPDADFYRERFFGLTKSVTAYRGFP